MRIVHLRILLLGFKMPDNFIFSQKEEIEKKKLILKFSLIL